MKILVLFGLIYGSSFNLSWAQSASVPVDSLDFASIFEEPFLFGLRPDASHFSRDEKGLFFTWNDSAYSKKGTYAVDFKSGKISDVGEDAESQLEMSPDKKWGLDVEAGDIFLHHVKSGNKTQVTFTPESEAGLRWRSDSKAFAFVRKNQVWISFLDSPKHIKVAEAIEGQANYRISGWAENGPLVLVQSEQPDHKTLYFPEYNGDFVDPGERRRGISLQRLSLAFPDSQKVRLLLEGSFWLRNVELSPDGKFLVADILDKAMKRRELQRYNLSDQSAQVIFRDSTQGWINFDYAQVRYAPGSNRLVMTSEKDGWNHLYVWNEADSDWKQLTSGDFEVLWWQWLDEKHLVFASNQIDYGEVHIYRLNVGRGSMEQLTKEEAYRTDFLLSKNGRYVVYTRSFWNTPGELYLLDTKKPKRERRLTQSIPEPFTRFDWLQPEYHRIPSRDDSTHLSLTVLGRQAGEQKPVVVFVHGAGSLQNVFKGWSNSYYREYVFHQYLASRGYVVLEVDYRHSLGYGRKFREDVAHWLGRYELRDIEDGLAFLGDGGGADTSRVGIYGGSYGGFMALYAASHSKKIDAAAALRAVTNWGNYYYANQWYTLPRLGDPEKDKENYLRSSPLYWVHKVKIPVLILHGLIDNNVGFQDAVQYIEKLIQLKKDHFEMMIYPTERHSFQDEDAWHDEYRRIYRFFERWLK